ncbi:hypothetical protein AALB81_13660 [Lachnospiraceae bacterium 48-33]
MVTTSPWYIKERLKDLINYVENPEKTVPKDRRDISHGYQSFKPDKVTPKQCHEIGLKLVKEM